MSAICFNNDTNSYYGYYHLTKLASRAYTESMINTPADFFWLGVCCIAACLIGEFSLYAIDAFARWWMGVEDDA